jgi:Flp pilus assembly protein TadG
MTGRFTTSRPAARRGGAVLETAIVLPLLLLMSFGFIEFADFFYLKHVLQGAAREGARAAILAGATDPSQAVADAMTAAGLGTTSYTVSTDPASPAPGERITVVIECNWSDVGLRPLHLISVDAKVRGSAVMMKEGS